MIPDNQPIGRQTLPAIVLLMIATPAIVPAQSSKPDLTSERSE